MTSPRRPLPADAAALARGIAQWQRLAVTLANPDEARFVAGCLDDPRARPLLEAIFGCSPYLQDCVLAEPQVLRSHLDVGPDATAAALLDEAASVDRNDRVRLMAGLRRSKRRLALAIALADMAGDWPLERVCATLTTFADLAVQRCLEHLLLESAKRGEIELLAPASPADGSGVFVLGMGKHGARELNYSSDIDLILLFDDEVIRCRSSEGAMAVAVRITRSLAYLLEQKTKDGYVFRTDLRLRPHLPGHPLAISTDAAELFYERHGQNWERASFIKARVVAGDHKAGNGFLGRLQPFIWRRHLDYAAIRDIHSIKRQINAFRGFGTINVRGHDLKVGRGGIREIEFFTQTQQLILGGRARELRLSDTCGALRALAAGRWIDAATAEALIEAYDFLRTIEHRIQMIGDRQTQVLPDRDAEFARVAGLAGWAELDGFERRVREVLETVERYYAALFEAEADLGAGGSLVFTGTEDDPETLKTLTTMGFRDASAISQRIRSWHHGHIRATRSTRARELLTELTPAIFRSLVGQSDPDAAFRLFDHFVTGLPAGVQLFSLLRANPRLLTLLADLMGTAPRLADHLSRNVDLFEAMLAPDFFEPLPDAAALSRELAGKLPDARDLQDVLDLTRRWAHGRQFQAGLQVLLGVASADEEAATLTAIAELVIGTLLPRVDEALALHHGRIRGGRFVVLGLGKLGSRELTTGSDLDLVFVYDAPGEAPSDGSRPLSPGMWYARLGQRLVSALSAQTAEGRLYEIDTRLRPSGNAGPVACSAENFARYQLETAQTWEQQALTRARVVAGDATLAGEVEATIDRAIRRRRDVARLAADVRAMRERIFREHGSDDPWALKQARGGLIELEFCAQFLQLAHVHAHPGLRGTSTDAMIEAAGAAGVIGRDVALRLREALRLYHGLTAVLRLSQTRKFATAEAPPRLREALLRAAAEDPTLPVTATQFPALERRLVETQAAVRQIFAQLCPAEAAGP
ncbi:MAG: bifunctional [glutamine synthetase] adenylyltransferase/[glutamine synthetase]-adenylyl-L-tyrosine phosphorylase [Geminicoccaceae bacterium]